MLLVVFSSPVVISGCSSPQGRTNVLCPGTESEQQRRAERFDPYPEPGIGPEVVGGRPREYLDPLSDPARARWVRTDN